MSLKVWKTGKAFARSMIPWESHINVVQGSFCYIHQVPTISLAEMSEDNLETCVRTTARKDFDQEESHACSICLSYSTRKTCTLHKKYGKMKMQERINTGAPGGDQLEIPCLRAVLCARDAMQTCTQKVCLALFIRE